jgi:hypothetical protein
VFIPFPPRSETTAVPRDDRTLVTFGEERNAFQNAAIIIEAPNGPKRGRQVMVLIVPWLAVVQVCELAQALAGENRRAERLARRGSPTRARSARDLGA